MKREPVTVAWFSPDDTLLVAEHLVGIVEYDDARLTLEVTPYGEAPHRVDVGADWTPLIGGLEVSYEGIFVNERCVPTHRAGIAFWDLRRVQVMRHSFAGKLIRGGIPLGRR